MGKVAGAMFVSSLPIILKKMRAAEIRVMKQAVNAAHEEVVKVLRGDRHGHTYKKPGTKHQYYTASKPGEPPAAPTGRMRGSVRGRVKSSLFGVEGQVGTPLDYPRRLEMEMDRVWLALGMRKAKPKIKRILGSRWF